MELVKGTPITRYCDDNKLTEKTMFAALGQVVGTLEYMSPEQADVRIERQASCAARSWLGKPNCHWLR